MNQQLIDRVVHKAGAHFGGNGINYSGFEPSKFAHLIVQECAEVADKAEPYQTSDLILKHFGVEL
jgi:hypothetical protein